MTAVLVTASAAKVHMRVTATADDTLIQGLVDAVEDSFLEDCGRKERPFATAATGRAEVKFGTGTPLLTVDYPIASATGITVLKIGYDVSDPAETLTATDIDEITVATGSRRIWRTDGGTFGKKDEPRMVHVTYNHNADTDVAGAPIAALAIKRGVAVVYRQIASEDAKSETLPNGYQRSLAQFKLDDPIWDLAVNANREPAA